MPYKRGINIWVKNLYGIIEKYNNDFVIKNIITIFVMQ